jgi:hypothetical protein
MMLNCHRSPASTCVLHAGGLLPVGVPAVSSPEPDGATAAAAAGPDWQSLMGRSSGQQRQTMPVFRPKLHLSSSLPDCIEQSSSSPAGVPQAAQPPGRRHRRVPLIVNITLSSSQAGGAGRRPDAVAPHISNAATHVGTSAAAGACGVIAQPTASDGSSEDGVAGAAHEYDDTLSEAAAAMRLDSQQQQELCSQPSDGQLEEGCSFSTRSMTVWRAAVPPATGEGMSDCSATAGGTSAGATTLIGQEQQATGSSCQSAPGIRDQGSRLVWWHCSEVIKGLRQKSSSSNTVG